MEINVENVLHDLEQCAVRRSCAGCSHDSTQAEGRCVLHLLTDAKAAIEALRNELEGQKQEKRELAGQ